jgi:pyocin large subunit-like protein
MYYKSIFRRDSVNIIKAFTVFSAAAVLGASLLCGCRDNNDDTPVQPGKAAVTTAIEIEEWATQKPSAVTEPPKTTKSTRTSKTETTKKKNASSTTKKDKNSKETTAAATTSGTTETTTVSDVGDGTYVEYHFRSKKLLNEHFAKHGPEFAEDFDYKTASDYEKGASDVINNSEALHKTEAEDGDGVYYIEATNEFVILSKDGYIRTYFRPNGGKSYYDRQ